MEAPKPLIFRILEVETRAARIEGIFTSDPELARMWRAQAALTEACRSVGLEDIHVFEGDVIHRHLENRLTDVEGARGAAAVAELLRVIVAPGHLIEDPERGVARCWEAAVSQDQEGPEFDLAETASHVGRAVQDAPTPLLGALKAAITHRLMTDSRIPSADRLIFMAAEHSLRAGDQTYAIEPDQPEALLRRIRANWIFTPSLALTQGRFRAWSPGSKSGHLELIDGIASELERTIGAVPMLRRWREDARATAAGKHGKSRLRDLVDLAMREPILTSPHVRRVLGVSERASLYLLSEAEAAGILTLITPRKSYRVWATPMMGQTLRMRASRVSGVGRGRAGAQPEPVEDEPQDLDMDDGVEVGHSSLEDENFEARTEAALAELDDAMAKADAVLAKYRTRH